MSQELGPSSADATIEPPSVGDSSSSPWWEKELRERTEFALGLGGPEGIERQHAAGRLTARERVDHLVDEKSWLEVGILTGTGHYDDEHRLTSVIPANVIAGTARIDGRDVAVAAEDFTVRGGSSEASSPDKWQYIERLALAYRLPMVRLVETAGGSVNILLKSGATKIPGYAGWPFTELLATVPVVGVALGAAAGLGTVRVVASHFSVMTRGTSWVFAGGPAIVKPGVGQEVTKEELGGSHIHTRSGVVDNEAEDELDALRQVRRFLSYLPSSVFDTPTRTEGSDSPDRAADSLDTAIPSNPRQIYDMRKILAEIFDANSLFEIGRNNGRSQITMLGRLDGYPVAILANDPRHLGGALTAESGEKLIRFIDMADTFHLPVVNLIDQPGTYVGSAAEAKGTVRKGIRVGMAMEQVSVPWCSLFVRRAFGLAGSMYGPIVNSVNVRYAWPSARWGSIPIEGGVEAAYRRELAEADDPDELRDQLMATLRHLENPFLTAERFGIQSIIAPKDTRSILCRWIVQAYRLLPETVGVSKRTMRA